MVGAGGERLGKQELVGCCGGLKVLLYAERAQVEWTCERYFFFSDARVLTMSSSIREVG